MLLKKYNFYFSYKYKYLFAYFFNFIYKNKIKKYVFFCMTLLYYFKNSFENNFFNNYSIINTTKYSIKFNNIFSKITTFSNFLGFSLLYENSYFF